ncbi:MAG: DinB family protein [Candidatus Eiseniibacteriota bacterium]
MSRRPSLAIAAMSALLLALAVAPAVAHDPPAATGGAGVKADMLLWIKDAEGKLIQLAEATPEGKYAWRPSKDVRTTGEVFMHVVAANYGAPSFWGVKPPEGFNFQTHEKSLTKKTDITKALKDSFTHMEQGLESTADADLDKPVELFGMKTTVRGGYMLLLSHAHEHLGQSIAYARSNGIVPPWTAKQQEEMKAQAEKMKAATK